MIIRQYEDQKHDQTKEIHFPVDPSRPATEPQTATKIESQFKTTKLAQKQSTQF